VNGELQTLEAEDDVRAYLSTQGLLGPAVSFLLRSVLPSGIPKLTLFKESTRREWISLKVVRLDGFGF
jgi:hypothetical protein